MCKPLQKSLTTTEHTGTKCNTTRLRQKPAAACPLTWELLNRVIVLTITWCSDVMKKMRCKKTAFTVTQDTLLIDRDVTIKVVTAFVQELIHLTNESTIHLSHNLFA